MNRPAPLLLVDGHALAYRSFHAIRSLSSPAGSPTNAIFGFIKTFRKLRKDLEPTRLAVVWDGGLAPERLTLLPSYKAQRPPMPPQLEPQLDGIMDWLRASGIASLCHEAVEADDWIATIARAAERDQTRTVIFSSDKDFMQLVSPWIGLLNPNDKSGRIWDESDVRAKSGVAPRQIVDWLSLIGDAVDNIPGVPGIGPKTATDLLGRFGSCDVLFERLDELDSPRLKSVLRESLPLVKRNRDMIRLRVDLELTPTWPALTPGPHDPIRLDSLYRLWGFNTLHAADPKPSLEQGTLELLP